MTPLSNADAEYLAWLDSILPAPWERGPGEITAREWLNAPRDESGRWAGRRWADG